jgi:outer membrane protein insertion porin family/translocation and assembly module TamA
MRRLFLSWACALALPSVLLAQTRDDQRNSPEVRRLVIDGAKNVDVHDLKKSISTQASACRNLILEVFCLFTNSPTFEDKHYLDESELRRDVVRIRLYYWKRGYRDTEVDTIVTPRGDNRVNVTFKVNEGFPTRVRDVAINYDSGLISDKTRSRLTLLRENDPLDLIRLDSMRVLFQDELWDQGYGDAVVDTSVVVDTATRRADVTLTLTQNRKTTVGRITITGNQKVAARTIRNSITFGPGDLYRLSDVLESQRNLYESNLFRLAAIEVPPQHDSVKNVDIDVTEAAMHEARVGPGLNSIDFLEFQAHYTDYNFFGGARRLDVDGTVGNLLAPQLSGRGPFRNVASDVLDTNVSPFLQPTYNASVDFKKPAFLRPGDAASIGAFIHRTINPGVFIDRGYGGQLTFTHQVRPRAPASVSYRYELNRVQASDTYFCVDYGVCDTLTIGSLRSHESLSPVTLTGFVDRSDAPFSPTKGYVARLDFEHASALTFSDFRYNRLFFDAAAYGHRSGTRNVYSAHIRVGLVSAISSGPESGVLHPRKRFYAGGANSVRGFAENQLGPRILTIDDSTLLRGATSFGGGVCAPTIDAVKFCDPNSPGLSNGDFLAQPLGGTSLLEGSVEYRVPLPLGETLRHFAAAAFIDGGVVGSGDLKGLQSISGIIKGQGAITPGIGLRYESSLGPIRLDLAFNPTGTEALGVVTTVRDKNGALILAPLSIPRNFSPGNSLFNRLTFHFSIGEAY